MLLIFIEHQSGTVMKIDLSETRPNHYYLLVPSKTDGQEAAWTQITHSIEELFSDEVQVCIDFRNVDQLSSDAFNLLHDMARMANENLSQIYYTNVDPALEERMNLLST